MSYLRKWNESNRPASETQASAIKLIVEIKSRWQASVYYLPAELESSAFTPTWDATQTPTNRTPPKA
jgi:hypothetical protein